MRWHLRCPRVCNVEIQICTLRLPSLEIDKSSEFSPLSGPNPRPFVVQGGFPCVPILTSEQLLTVSSAASVLRLSAGFRRTQLCPCSQVILTAILIVLNLLDELEELHSYRGNWKVVSCLRLLRGCEVTLTVFQSQKPCPDQVRTIGDSLARVPPFDLWC